MMDNDPRAVEARRRYGEALLERHARALGRSGYRTPMSETSLFWHADDGTPRFRGQTKTPERKT